MKPLLPDVIVNGELIVAERIAAEAQNHPAPQGKPGLAWQAAARALAVRALLLQEAQRRGVVADVQETLPGQLETEAEALIRQLLDEAVQPAPVTEAELQAFYAAHPVRFRAPSLYEAAHILIPLGEDAHAAQHHAQAVLDQALAEPRRFDGLALDHSACSSKANGGRLGQISAGDTVPEFEAALATMQEGQINPVLVRSRYGFHIIRLDARARGEVLPFAAVQAPLMVAQEKAAWLRASRAFIASLVAKAEVSGITLKAA